MPRPLVEPDIQWHQVRAVEALVGGKLYRVEAPRGADGAANVYCNDEFIGPARSLEDGQDAVARGLC